MLFLLFFHYGCGGVSGAPQTVQAPSTMLCPVAGIGVLGRAVPQPRQECAIMPSVVQVGSC